MSSQNHILVVTPYRTTYDLIAEGLAGEDVEVYSASCLQEAALRLVAAPPRPIVLYDTDTSGEWRVALENFLLIRHESCIILLSRLADDQMWMDVLEYGGYDLLMKPFRPMEVRSVVRGALLGINVLKRSRCA